MATISSSTLATPRRPSRDQTVPMNSSRQQDRDRLAMFIHGANIAHFLSLLGRETNETKRAAILMLLAEEREKEKAACDLTTAGASPASPFPNRELGAHDRA
ncbi:MAG: hypothetical protein ABSE69_07320 [Roseiarcus sp.]